LTHEFFLSEKNELNKMIHFRDILTQLQNMSI